MPKYWGKQIFAHGRFPEVVKSKRRRKRKENTPGTAGGPGGRDRTLAVKSKKIARKSPFFLGEKKITQKTYFFFAYIF